MKWGEMTEVEKRVYEKHTGDKFAPCSLIFGLRSDCIASIQTIAYMNAINWMEFCNLFNITVWKTVEG